MPHRLLDIVVPTDRAPDVRGVLEDQPLIASWEDRISDDRSIFRVLLDTGQAEAVTDLLESRFAGVDGFRLILLSVAATIPRAEPPPEPEPIEPEKPEEPPPKPASRISREELYSVITKGLSVSRVYVVTVVLSAVVAAVGLLRDNVAIIIGAMVIAPLLGPNIALALATTLGDMALARRATIVNIAGMLIAFAFSVAVGLVLPVDPTVGEIAARTMVGPGDVVLALASGAAGALAFTTGASASLVGVMVAVALLPPLATVGLLLASGHVGEAGGAMLLLATNIVCVNLAGVVTFLAQGVRPKSWWESKRARKATRLAVILWTIVLGLLAVLMTIAAQRREARSATPARVVDEPAYDGTRPDAGDRP